MFGSHLGNLHRVRWKPRNSCHCEPLRPGLTRRRLFLPPQDLRYVATHLDRAPVRFGSVSNLRCFIPWFDGALFSSEWKARSSTGDQPTGPRQPRSTTLSVDEEAIVIAFRRRTLLPLDDCLYALQPTIPHLTRSTLHRCFQRHGVSRLPDADGDKPQRSKFKRYPIGFFHIDIAEVRTAQGKLYQLVAIDRTSKFAFVQLHEKPTCRIAGDFLRALAAAVPYEISIVLTDNGTHFTEPTGDGWTPEDIKAIWAEGKFLRCHAFELACADLDIEHRLTKPRHPWTNGQVERMNRTIKDATVKRFYYETHDELRKHLADFVAAYNYARRLKTLRGLTPFEAICKPWAESPSLFTADPNHQLPVPNI